LSDGGSGFELVFSDAVFWGFDPEEHGFDHVLEAEVLMLLLLNLDGGLIQVVLLPFGVGRRRGGGLGGGAGAGWARKSSRWRKARAAVLMVEIWDSRVTENCRQSSLMVSFTIWACPRRVMRASMSRVFSG